METKDSTKLLSFEIIDLSDLTSGANASRRSDGCGFILGGCYGGNGCGAALGRCGGDSGCRGFRGRCSETSTNA